ncbi:signal recognition particle-docking protein FtsY [Limosilactobacillus caecicola]|uniref:signal recognition particle-docking protein FtsY n=1 Tax=Limosilactobacillus caecicola TaxID=2941332 RepID=UPI00203EF758|nr:signal recognition particle-docking protein FtsY [Limosilactobacillus caecicola]
MGLFDIFRRRHKKEQSVEQPSTQSTTTSAVTSESTTGSLSANSLTSLVTSTSQSISVSVSESVSESTSLSVAESVSSSQAEVSETESVSVAVSESVTNSEQTVASLVEQSLTQVAGSSQSTISSVASLTSTSTSEAANEGSATVEDTVAEGSTVDEQNSAASDEERKYDSGLAKSRHGFGARLNKFLANFRHVDEDFFDDLEDMMIESDVGYDMAMKLSDSLREEVKLQNAKSKQDVSNVIIQKMVELYDAAGEDEQSGINFAKSGPTVIMFVGVNGAGKTTTIGKMAARYKKQGKKVLLAAADTFRAGATEQLDVWAKRDGVDIVTGPENGDPAAVVFDGVKKAKDEGYDILFVDTAGRLQNKVNLMNELAKMKRILTREIPDAPHEVLLVLDATTGQNALNQAKLFKESTDVTGIVLTKLDGTARGGIVLAIRNELHLPVKFVGLGEKVDDLQAFDAGEFVYGLFKGLVTTD